ncbi:MAG: translation initiation factor IF-2 [candidate division Zixibacteria bacterium]|nr:translation initiation factor IF-2 [candidate division Zixibacteria bacterium]
MSSKRLYEVARDHNLSADALMALVNRLGFDVRSHMSVAEDDLLAAIEAEFGKQKDALKAEIALRERKTRERKAKAREAAELEAQRAAEVHQAAEKVRLEEEERKAKEAAETAAKAAVAAAEAARLHQKKAPVAPSGPPLPYRPKPAQVGIVGRPGGGVVRPQSIAGRPGGATALAPGRPGALASSAPAVPGAEVGRRRRRRSSKKKGSRVDQQEVAASFRKTIAELGTRAKPKRRQRRDGEPGTDFAEPTKTVEVNEFMSIAELAHKMGVSPTEVVAKCLELGMLATVNQRLDLDTIETIAIEFDYAIKQVEEIGEEVLGEDEEEAGTPGPIPPVVTIMGHVDHGKTSLLDHIRTSNVVAGEKGGITQHIGAYSVQTQRGRLTFLDTPGHEAFTAMRARGAQATDIVILVVAVDDAVMPQTIEAIDHAKAAGVPIVVAINKMDLPGADPERVKTQLSDHGLIPEEWSGTTIMVPVSARTGMGVDKLLEMVLLQAELLELKAAPDRRARGVIIEAQLDRGRGPVATVLVKSGTLRAGDYFVTGPYWGRVRNMVDERGRAVIEAPPATPVQVTGSSGVAQAGDSFVVSIDEQQARHISQIRERLRREQTYRRIAKLSLTNVYDRIKEGAIRDLKIIIKGDVDGSVEVLADTLTKIKSDEIQVNVIHRGVGAISETDILLAAASEAVVIGFHVRPDSRARELAAREGVDVRLYDIIYEVESDIRSALEGMLTPIEIEERTCEVVVKNIFKISKVGTIAGCEVTQGVARPRDQVRIVRDGVTIYTAALQTVRRFSDDVKEVAAGLECGIKIENYNDIKVGDVFELFRVVQQERKLTS